MNNGADRSAIEVADLRFQLRARRLHLGANVVLTILGALLWVALLVAIYIVSTQWRSVGPNVRLLLVASFGISVYLTMIIVARWRSRRVTPSILLEADGVRLPTGRYGSASRKVSYEDISSLYISGRGNRRVVVLGAKGNNFVLEEVNFVDDSQFGLMVMAIRRRIGLLPEGERQLALIGHNLQFTKKAVSKPTRVTHALVALLGLIYVGELYLGTSSNPFRLVRLGANAPILFEDGQFYRLVTANFLHANAMHVGLNGLALLSLGVTVERLMGSARFLLVYIFSAFLRALTSALMAEAPFSVGASTAVFGALGSMFVINVKYRRRLPAGFNQSPRWWAFILGLNAALPLVVPQIDVAAHVGGFATGVVITLALAYGYDATQLLVRAPGRWTVVLTLTVSMISGLAIIQGSIRAAQNDVQDELRVVHEVISAPDATANQLDQLARLLLDTDTAGHREAARRSAQRAVDKAPDNERYRRTLERTQR